jgi:rubredoxin
MSAPGRPKRESFERKREGGSVNAGPKYECKICWTVYDPEVGDPVWQIAPGTPFGELPPHWTCPNCFNEKSGFLLLSDD